MSKWKVVIIVLISVLFLAACNAQKNISSNPNNSSSETNTLTRIQENEEGVSVTSNTIKISQGQIIYVPVYSHAYHGNGQKYFLAITLSIQNTSLNHPIIIRSVRYYNSGGKLVKEYTQGNLQLAPLASTDFFIPEQDETGGSGANFIVEWIADQQVTEPVIEALMIATRSQQGISFVTSGRVIQELQPEQ
ncbi:hypothetical protein Sta7437_4450 [Stanieria cyanosphaera PCC 7437]|uniref:DUF3124 domain-containing protein n=1 Tax=Stanieria cyanosphaera (strain ATCC 29371 / PCC 7437) TaxID=111780 RepID=K9Y0J7_STAC7|nr:DUF3124 domain-containing protein [Stanieria cyanosphaera]AFZ37916.1 hypothetical protein Sta7437_4450 [Stanieria cyanosphaera PCC 7437]